MSETHSRMDRAREMLAGDPRALEYFDGSRDAAIYQGPYGETNLVTDSLIFAKYTSGPVPQSGVAKHIGRED